MFLILEVGVFILTGFCVNGQPCDVNCITPDCTNIYCSQCKDEFYPVFGECKPCVRDNCKKCFSADNCRECEIGFYRYQTSISTSICLLCSGNCVKCSSWQYCSECKPGYYGNRCNYACNLCNKDMCGKNYCTNGCRDGYYEFDNDDNGLCFPCTDIDINCLTCTIIDSIYTCNQCKTDFYIESGRCAQCNGIDQCGMCPDGKWGENCDTDCFNCNKCNKHTGVCISGCINGYYKGPNNQCTQPCTVNCFNGVCDRNNGTCTEGCNVRYSGPMCNDQCAHTCKTCYQDDSKVCSSCYPGYYSTFCNMTCSETCVDTGIDEFVCDASGFCLYRCENGFTGDMCQRKILTDLRTDTSTIFANQPTKDSPHIAAIAGGVTGGIVVILTIVVVIVIMVKRRHDKKPHTYENENVMKDMRSNTTTATDNVTVATDIEATSSNTDTEYSNIGEAIDRPGSGYETLDMHQSVEAQYTSLP